MRKPTLFLAPARIHRVMGWTGLTVFAAIATFFAFQSSAPAYPDEPGLQDLNFHLRKVAPEIFEELANRKYKNVGVLKFQVQINDRKPTMHAGRLNQQMATRLENALILANDPKEPTIGVTRNAGQEAMKQNKKATWLTEKGREELLKGNYPLAWGAQNEPVDAFLTGIVELNAKKDSKNIAVANVKIQVFDKKNLELKELTSFQARLTPNLLAESGQRFVVEKRTLKTSTGGTIIDQNPVIPEDTGGTITPTDVDKDFNKVLQFKIFYNGKEEEQTPSPDGSYQCKPPLVNDEIVFKMKSPEKIGLVLFVNGINTLEMARADKGDIMQQTRWILDPNQEYTIKGFYPTFKKHLPFKSAPDQDAEPGDLGPEDKWGLIELHVLKDAGKDKEVLPTTPNLQGSHPPELELRSLMLSLKKINNTPARKLIIPDKLGTEPADIKEVQFNGTLYASRTIIYSKIGN